MLTRTTRWLAGAAMFLLGLGALPAAAQTPTAAYFRATATTNGFPGTYTDTPPVVAGAPSNSASSYPRGVSFNGGTQYAEATASSHSRPGHASSAAYSYAQRVSTKVYPTNNILANAEGSFTESLNVESGTLPAGTEVTLKFRAATAIAKFSNENTYYGSARVELQIGSSGGYATWTTQNGVPEPEVQSPEITVKTRVGARLTFSGKAFASTAAWFYNFSTRVTDGKLGLEVSMDVERIDTEWDVTVRSASGKIFQPMP